MQDLEKEFSSHICKKLLDAKFDSIKLIVVSNVADIQSRTRLSYKDVKLVVQTAAKLHMADKIITAFEANCRQRIATGCKSIDMVLNGGIPINGINEIFGISGVGKTQLCLQLSLMVQLPKQFGGLEKGAVYICTEDPFPSKRLNNLIKLLPIKFPILNMNFTDNIFVEHIGDFEQLRRFLYLRLEKLLCKIPIGLLVIDSIAGVFRSDNKDVNYVKRSEIFLTISSILHQICDKWGICIVCVNQMMDDLDTGRSKPCLGLSWTNIVTNRFEITRNGHNPVRSFKIVFSPELPVASSDFIIKDIGVTEIG